MLKRKSIIVHSFGGCQKWAPAGRIGDFENFFNDFAKSPRVLPSSRIFNEWNLYCKIVKYCILSEVCMIKTAPQSTVSPQMWWIKSIKGWFTRPQICWLVNLSNAKNSAWFFSRPDQEPLWLLNVIEDDCYFLGVHIKPSTRCKIWFSLALFANYFSLKSLSLSLKSHMNVL